MTSLRMSLARVFDSGWLSELGRRGLMCSSLTLGLLPGVNMGAERNAPEPVQRGRTSPVVVRAHGLGLYYLHRLCA